MKRLTVVLSLLLACGPARGRDRLPDEEARKAAKLLAEAARKVKLPLRGPVDTEKPYAKRKDDYVALVLPARGLSAEALGRLAKDDVLPAGQLWLHSLAPVVDGKVLPTRQLQTVTITCNDQEHTVAVCCLGVRRGGKDSLELALYSKDATPLLRVPLEKTDDTQELPIEFTASLEGEGRAVLTVNVLGRYRAKLGVGTLAD